MDFARCLHWQSMFRATSAARLPLHSVRQPVRSACKPALAGIERCQDNSAATDSRNANLTMTSAVLAAETCGVGSLISSGLPLGGHSMGRGQRQTRPIDKFIGLVEQPIWHTPKSEIDEFPALCVIQGGRRAGLLEGRPVFIVNSKIEDILGHHTEHRPVTEYTRLSKHTPHRDTAQRSQLLAQELGICWARHHAGIGKR